MTESVNSYATAAEANEQTAGNVELRERVTDDEWTLALERASRDV